MKMSFSGWLHRARHPLMLACATYPLAFMLGLVFQQLWPLAALAGAYILLAELCLLLPGRVRLWGGMAGAALLIALGILLLPVARQPLTLAIPVGYAILLMIGLPMAAWPRERETHMAWPALGLMGYIILIELLHGPWNAAAGRASMLVLYLGFVMQLTLTLLGMNRVTIRDATAGRARAPARVKRRNMLMTLGYLALGLGVAMLPGIVRVLRMIWQGLKRLIAAVAAWLMNLFPPLTGGGSEGAPSAPESFGMAVEEMEPSFIRILLERIMAFVAFLALMLLALMLLRVMYRGLRRLARAIMARLGRFASSASEDYVDEITDTRDEGGEKQRVRPWRQGIGLGGDNRLPPRERVRRRYLRLRWKHPEWHGGMTARETLPPYASEIYERARYSSHEVTEEDARAFLDGVRRV